MNVANAARRRVYDLAFENEDEEEDFIVRRPRWIRQREDHFHSLDDKDFEIRFRLSKRSVLYVLTLIEDRLEFPHNRNNSISPMNQLLCALRYYATGCFQTTAGDLGGFSQPTASRIVHRVSTAIALLRPMHVFFPETPDDIKRTQLDFHKIARFPKVIGAIDCTHVRLMKAPGGNNGEVFRNRKGYFSLNVQAICNAKLEFTDIVTRWPGSANDSNIFNNSRRRALFVEGVYGDAVLVGDGGYGCKPFLMTPLDACHTDAEQLYNESQIRTRNPIERLFGVWKRRFPAVALGLRVSLENTFAIVVATAVLHNIARRAGEQVPPDDRELVLPAPWDVLVAQGYMDHGPRANLQQDPPRRENPNHRARRVLINTYFADLARREVRDRQRAAEQGLDEA